MPKKKYYRKYVTDEEEVVLNNALESYRNTMQAISKLVADGCQEIILPGGGKNEILAVKPDFEEGETIECEN